jgi:hypothetical protein
LFDALRGSDRAPPEWPQDGGMAFVRILVLAALTAGLLGAAPSAATTGTIYALITPPSSLQVGCQGPCECPIAFLPTYGSFELVRTGVDPLYTYYAVERYIASFNNGPGAVSITGSGQFKIGGEFALMQELTLDLEVEGQPTEHFDSGLKPVSVPLPRIDISCAVHGFHCFDSVLVVDAKPADPAGTQGPPLPPAGLQTVRPNPFERETTISFTLDQPGFVDLMVIDLEGRRVRSLAAGEFIGPGPQTMTWEGRRDDGRVAPAGVYWMQLRWPGGVDRRRIVKLH